MMTEPERQRSSSPVLVLVLQCRACRRGCEARMLACLHPLDQDSLHQHQHQHQPQPSASTLRQHSPTIGSSFTFLAVAYTCAIVGRVFSVESSRTSLPSARPGRNYPGKTNYTATATLYHHHCTTHLPRHFSSKAS